MSDREQLLELRKDIAAIGKVAGLDVTGYLGPLDRLLARWPYEPWEEIEVFFGAGNEWRKRYFLCVDPDAPEMVLVAGEGPGDAFSRHSRHRPIPKFRTLEVPEEKIELARKAAEGSRDGVGAAMAVCQWLAREAGKSE